MAEPQAPGAAVAGRRAGLSPLLLAAVLLAAAVASALAVIWSAHRSRELFRELEKSRREQNEIQIEWRQLLLERSTLSSHARVEAIAGQELQMKLPEGEMNMVVVE